MLNFPFANIWVVHIELSRLFLEIIQKQWLEFPLYAIVLNRYPRFLYLFKVTWSNSKFRFFKTSEFDPLKAFFRAFLAGTWFIIKIICFYILNNINKHVDSEIFVVKFQVTWPCKRSLSSTLCYNIELKLKLSLAFDVFQTRY